MTAAQRIEDISNEESDGPICIWDVSGIESFTAACGGTHEHSFNSDLYWDTSAATNMDSCFVNNVEFNGDLSAWNVSIVEWMNSMFRGSGISDSGIGNWDVSSVINAAFMFADARSLSPKLSLSGWQLGSVQTVSCMFKGSSVVDTGILTWRLPPLADKRGMLEDTKLHGAAAPQFRFGETGGGRDDLRRSVALAFANARRETSEARKARKARKAGGAGASSASAAQGRLERKRRYDDDGCCIL
jgi:hypothetical protein